MGERTLPWASVPPELAYVLVRDACPDVEVKAQAMVATGHPAVGERMLFGIRQLREVARQFVEAQRDGRGHAIGSAGQAGDGRSEVPVAQEGACSPRLRGGDGADGLTTQEVAVMLKRSSRQVINLIDDKRLTATFTRGRWLIDEVSVDLELERRSNP